MFFRYWISQVTVLNWKDVLISRTSRIIERWRSRTWRLRNRFIFRSRYLRIHNSVFYQARLSKIGEYIFSHHLPVVYTRVYHVSALQQFWLEPRDFLRMIFPPENRHILIHGWTRPRLVDGYFRFEWTCVGWLLSILIPEFSLMKDRNVGRKTFIRISQFSTT